MDKWDRITDFCCKSCMYYAPKTEDLGRCKRNAPTMAGFPVVYAETDWCGEHKLGTNPTKRAVPPGNLYVSSEVTFCVGDNLTPRSAGKYNHDNNIGMPGFIPKKDMPRPAD